MADTLIASGSLAQVQTHLSLVAGTSFADLQGVNLGLYLGQKLVVWDSAMRPASAYPVAAGTGETYGPNLSLNGNGTGQTDWIGGPPPTSWTQQAGTLSAVAGGQLGTNCLQVTRTSGTQQGGYQQVLGGASGELRKFTVYVMSGSSGNEAFSAAYNQPTTPTTGTSSAAWVQYGNYSTYTGVDEYIRLYKDTGTAGTMLFDVANLVKVLIPSIMGAIVSSKPSGTPGDAWSIAPNFNYNDTSGYTWAILSESSSIMYSFPEDKTQIDRRPRNKAYAEPFVNFQSPGSAPIWLAPVLVDDIRKHTNLKAFSRAYYEPWGQFQPPVSAPRLPLTADVSDKTAHTNRKVPRAYFDFASKAPTQKDGNINPSPQASGRYRGWASNWAIGVKEDFPWS